MKLINIAKKQSKKMPLKRAKTGLEIEMHVLDNKGNLSYKGFYLTKLLKKKYPSINIVKECGMNMVEIGCYPDIQTYNPALETIRSIEKLIKIAKKHGLKFYPFGTYPGKIKSRFTPDPAGKYKIQKKIFGEEKFALATKAVGFHHHYTLPKGVFDYEKKDLRLLIDSKLKRSFLNCYNFEISIDPVLTLFTQSSPFFEGKFLAKDSRMLIYRGGRKLKYPGLYNKFQQIGALPPYKQTETDLIRSIKRRQQRWKKLIKKADPDTNMKKLYPYKLDICWNPIKVNKHGTLEERGMDMNYMGIILAVSGLIKFCLKKIQRDFIEVIPADRGIEGPFKIRKGIMFIPPHTYVRDELQKASAYEGFKNDKLYEYAKKFYKFAKSLSSEFYYPLYKKIENMIEKRSSVSDDIIQFAKNKKLINSRGEVSNKNARVIALHFSKKFEQDLRETKKIIKNMIVEHQKIINK